MDRIDIRPPADWRAMTREQKLEWARAVMREMAGSGDEDED